MPPAVNRPLDLIRLTVLGPAFRPALIPSALMLISYPLIATSAGMPASQRLVDVGVLLFTNVVGVIVYY